MKVDTLHVHGIVLRDNRKPARNVTAHRHSGSFSLHCHLSVKYDKLALGSTRRIKSKKEALWVKVRFTHRRFTQPVMKGTLTLMINEDQWWKNLVEFTMTSAMATWFCA